jgi:putative addiction module CopG family antidote
MLGAMNAIKLTPELEAFADEAVAQGRFRDVADVVQAGVSLLRRAEAERAAFVETLAASQMEGERQGFLTLEESMRDIDALIEEMAGTGS